MTKNKVTVAAVAILVAAAMIMTPAPKGNTVLPHTTKEFAKTSAMILPTNRRSGGSGVILKSTKEGSYVLSNRHVCEIIQTGGVVKTSGKEYRIRQYKLYKKHDLCILRVAENLGVDTALALKGPKIYSPASISGHPALLPHVLTQGHFSDKLEIEVMVGFKPCDGTESGEEMLMCMFMGGKAIIRKFKTQLVTALIQPGSSGSGVFNADGELSGLVFAGSQGMSFAYIVPFEYVNDFLATHNKTKWRRPNPNATPKTFMSFPLVKNSIINSLWVDQWQR